MNPMQSPNTGVGRTLCPEGRECTDVDEAIEVLEADEIIMPGQKSKTEQGRETLNQLAAIMRIWMR